MPDISTLQDQIGAMTPLAFALVFLAGLLMGFAPSSLPLYSVVIGNTVTAETESSARPARKGFTLAVGFVLGMATVDIAIGALFGLIGREVIVFLTSYLVAFNLLLAGLLAVFALALMRKITIRLPRVRPILRQAASFRGAYALGIPFGLSACPACTPMVLPILGAAAATGTPWLGAVLMFIFGLARGLPLLLVGTAVGSAFGMRQVARATPVIERVTVVLLWLGVAYFLYQSAAYASYVPPFQFLFS